MIFSGQHYNTLRLQPKQHVDFSCLVILIRKLQHAKCARGLYWLDTVRYVNKWTNGYVGVCMVTDMYRSMDGQVGMCEQSDYQVLMSTFLN
jgi:hypothetical protein